MPKHPIQRKKRLISIFLILFVAQVSTQIQCYIQKFQAASEPAGVPLYNALIKAFRDEVNHVNRLNKKGIVQDLQGVVNVLQQFQARITDARARAIMAELIAPSQALQLKFQSGNGTFNEISILNIAVRFAFRKRFGDICPTHAEGLPTGIIRF